jgi:ABC-2 type transport system ATP-binding protein
MGTIIVENLTRDYGASRGVFELSFKVERGEAFGFLGPNGAGKTTTIRHLMGFLRPKIGRCTIDGLDCRKDSAKIMVRLGYIPGEISFFNEMTGEEFFKFSAKYRKIRTNDRKKELLERFELDSGATIKKMSKGMKQKVGIVAAFMHDPEILLLDEPTSGLDPLMQSRFIDLVAEEKERGKTILLSSHMFEEVERTCHRVGIIRDGRLVATDSVDTLKAAQTKKYIVTFENSKATENFTKESLQTEILSRHTVAVIVQSNIGELISLLNKYPVTNLAAPSQSLEEVFLHYYGGAKNV